MRGYAARDDHLAGTGFEVYSFDAPRIAQHFEEHGFTAGPDGAVIFDVFAPPREEYTREGSGFS